MVYVVAILLTVAFWIFCILEALLADRFRVRTLPKWAWVLTTIAVPVAGGLLWFALGRPRGSDDRGGGNGGNGGGGGVRGPAVPPRGPIAPDDDPEFLQRLRWEAERERRRRERDASKDGPGTPGAGAGGSATES